MPNQPQILVYVRDYFWDIYHNMFQGLNDFELILLTDFPKRKVAAINPDFHRQLEKGELSATGLDETEIIRRCRLLRNLAPNRAVRMLRAMHAALCVQVESGHWVAIMGQTVDDYVTHLLALLAEKRGIPYLGFCSSYFPGYTQITVGWDGVCAVGRSVSSDESQAMLDKINSDRFRQDYNIVPRYDFGVHVARIVRYYMKRVYFAMMRRLNQAPYHVHYLLQPFLAQQKRLSDYPRKGTFHLDWEQRLATAAKPLLYIPLGYTPECSTDYMIRDVRYIDYEATILRITEVLRQYFTVLVKDHFHMLGSRSLEFYARMRAIPNVVLVPAEANSNALLAHGVDYVVSGGGSVGIEATIRGKTLFSFSNSIYWQPTSRSRYLHLDELAQWPQQISEFRSAPPAPREFVQSLLGYMLPFDFMKITPHAGSKGRQLEFFLKTFLASRRTSAIPA